MSGTEYDLTANYGLKKPHIDADDDEWGLHLNQNADLIDNLIKTQIDGMAGLFLPLAGGEITGNLIVDSALQVGTPAAFSVSIAGVAKGPAFLTPNNIAYAGAKVDGVTNDSAAITTTLAAATTNSTILIPHGGGALVYSGITGGPAGPIRWEIDGVTTGGLPVSAIGNRGVGDLVENFVGGVKHLYSTNAPVDFPGVLIIDYKTAAAGGTANFVTTPFRINATDAAGTVNAMFAGHINIDSFSNSPAATHTSVGLNVTANKRGTSGLQGIHISAFDWLGSASSTAGPFTPLEISQHSNGPDDYGNGAIYGAFGGRAMFHLSQQKRDLAGADTEFAAMFSIDGDSAQATTKSVFLLNPSLRAYQGLDTRGAAVPSGYADPFAAVRMASGQIIDFAGGAALNSGAGRYLQYTTTGTARLRLMAGATEAMSISDAGNEILNGSLIASNAQTVKVQLLGGGGQGFVQSLGGRLTIQAPAGFQTTLTPQGIAGANDVININQRLDVFPFILGTPAKVAGHHQGMRVVANDTIVSDDGVWHLSVTSNIGAIMWATGEALATTGNERNSGGNIYTNTSTGTCGPTPPAGTGTGISDGGVTWVYARSDFVGNRVGLNSYVSVRGRTGPTAPTAQLQWSAASGTISIFANQGGTSFDAPANTRGIIYGGGQQVWVYPGATYLTGAVGFESDLAIFNSGNRATAGSWWRVGGNFVSYGDDQGVAIDTPLLFGGRNDSGVAVPWRNILQVGENAISASGALKTEAIFGYRPRAPGSIVAGSPYINPGSIIGFDLSNIDFDTAALIGPSNSGIDRLGALLAGAGKISTNTAGLSLDIEALGSVISDVAWVRGTGFKVGERLYYPYDGIIGGLVINILTVDGSGKPLTWSIDPATGGRPGATLSGSPPAGPLNMWGGSGGVWGVPAQFTPTWSQVRKIRVGPTSATAIEIGNTGATTTLVGTVVLPATSSGAFLPLGGGNLTGLLTGVGITATGTLTAGAGSSGNSILVLNSPAGSTRAIRMQSAGSNRWQFAMATAESGSNVGGDLNLTRYDDSGASLGNAISINRATGAVTITQLAAPTIGDGASALTVAMTINRPSAAANAQTRWQTAGSNRWIQSIATAEGGSNAGSDWMLQRYDDTATLLGTALVITRSTGAARFGASLSAWNAVPPAAKPSVTGSRAGNAALASLLTALASYGLLTDSSSA